MYKFNSIGWRNVSVSIYMGAIGGLLVIIVSVSGKDERLWVEGPGTKLTKFFADKLRKYCQPRVRILNGSFRKRMQLLS